MRTLVVAAAAGTLLLALARRFQFPSIVVLLAAGMALGPEGIALLKPESLGYSLPVIVSLAVGLILFEGGLTLEVRDYRAAPGVIRRLLTVGVLTTWLATALLIFGFFSHSLFNCLLSASLIIVTGPTVIIPLLKRIRLAPRVHSILHWEGVLIDPVGVFVALLCFEWFGDERGVLAFGKFALRVGVGLGVGVGGAYAMYRALRRKAMPENMIGAFSVAGAVLIFGTAEMIVSESGLLAATAAGLALGIWHPDELKQIRTFKGEITDLLIGTLFMLLASRLSIRQFYDFGLKGAACVASVMLLVRPLNIALSSLGLGIPWRERLFLSWIAPRGIVAASMASLFRLRLESESLVRHPEFIETFTYSVIMATIVLQGLTAGPLAGLLGLKRARPTGWLVVGTHLLARRVAHFIAGANVPVVLIDSNPRAVAEAQREGLTAVTGDARSIELMDSDALLGVGNLLAVTDNEDLNMVACDRWADIFGRDSVHRWARTAPESAAGRAVWRNLPKPSIVSAEAARGQAEFTESPNALGPGIPLVYRTHGRAALEPAGLAPGAAVEVLSVIRSADYLRNSTRPELMFETQAATVESVVREAIERMARIVPVMPVDGLVREIAERERSFPSALGKGVAVPHAYSAKADSALCAIVRAPAGIAWHAHDELPVNLVFVLISPTGDPDGHLTIMAEIATLAANEDLRRQMLESSSPSDALSLLERFGASHGA